ncbi:1,3-beta-glucanosyltransferase [Coprinopsis cinerea okayama7|uniref:1,3-beta-glucanosyltransferase n=1 Tax=Coprinopsis cinerea (strain Okayama-7 / 130 / ATCC MYA-4618 / FGSC 9003) TaxID=240176 RepID=D6RJX7_COPC7|nr:1,3-beta-glucanosyltransferase [Coprinopsis cinerea okayama7\|eukprot:XP_002912150.1 1,3-beta-glucanosyltransferase [Coprinopsis cinerea okayama7\
MFVSLRAFAAVAALISQVAAIPKVTRTGRYLYQEDGTRFYIKGIGYQVQGEVHESDDNHFGEPGTFEDPLADPDACRRDLPLLTDAGVNTLRVYSVNSSLNHDECMEMFSEAGIYTIIDLSIPLNGSIDRLAPSWSTNLLNLYIRTIDAFEKYDNVIAYNVGNEVVLTDSTEVAPYVKAAARDTKAYLKSIGSEALVGYAAINGPSGFRKALADYLSCGSEETAIDLYGLNEYTWCGDSSLTSSGYASVTSQFADYNVVAYFSEYGCIDRPPRLWTEVDALFSSDMSDVWSGGIAFSYFPAQSAAGQFGLVTVSDDGSTVTVSEEFQNLADHYSAVTGPNSPSRNSVPASTYPACAASVAGFDASNTLPATPNESACNCLQSALSCQFTPPIADYSDINGELLNIGCSLLGESGGSCDEIGGSGATGIYGRLSGCDPVVKLSYVMSQFYEGEGRDARACSFSGNGTVNAAASSTESAEALASSCIANPDATFAPSAPATDSGPASGTPTRGSGNNNDGDAGSAASLDVSALVGVSSMAVVGVLSGIWALV